MEDIILLAQLWEIDKEDGKLQNKKGDKRNGFIVSRNIYWHSFVLKKIKLEQF